MTILYIHGYGSNGNATKGQLLRSMLPEHRVVSPTFDYDHRTPEQIQEQIKRVIGEEEVRMIVGSSFGSAGCGPPCVRWPWRAPRGRAP